MNVKNNKVKNKNIKNTTTLSMASKECNKRDDSIKSIKTNSIVCSVAKSCGGCQSIHIPYEKQLEGKELTLKKLLGTKIKINPIEKMDNPYNYRNKVHAVFHREKNGNIISGVYTQGTHKVVSVDNCFIEDKRADEIIKTIRGLLKSFKIIPYNEDTREGLLRHVLIRRGFNTGEIMVVLVMSTIIFPSKNNFIKALCKIHPEITTIVLNVNDKKTSMVLGDREKVIYGKGYIEDTLLGYTFKISSKSFYQVNPIQTEVLYKKAIELAELKGAEVVIDAYCGIGTIGIIASKHAKKVIGVELNNDAVKDAIINAKLNNIKNIKFYNEDASDFMVKLALSKESIDVVIMDPPRSGSTEKFMDSIIKLSPKKVIYISCNPVTLARDLKYLDKKGYKAENAWPVDMFPHTEHVETVVSLTRTEGTK